MALESEELAKASSQGSPKRPYRQPELRKLGTVADLTLAGGGVTLPDPAQHLTTTKSGA